MTVFGRAILVALLATGASGLPMAALLTWDMESGLRFGLAARLLLFALLGNFLIGLPFALLVYRQSADRKRVNFGRLIGLANFAAGVIALILIGSSGLFGLVFLGIPIVFAANVFAIAGWFLIVKPARANI